MGKSKKNIVVINSVTKKDVMRKLYICIALLVILVIISVFYFRIVYMNSLLIKDLEKYANLNTSTVFSIDKIYMYSNVGVSSNEDTRPLWNVDIMQYTDICIYINNRSEEGLSYENTIKELYISDIGYSNISTGKQALYYKSINNFGKFENNEQNLINEKEDYKFEIINNEEIDYGKNQLYSNCQNPITLEYVNANIKENYIISDITKEMKFDGSLLKASGVLLDDIKGTISFKIHITNYYDQEFVADVNIDIPLNDNYKNTSIYDGKFEKKINYDNYIKFFRIK